MKKGKVTFKVHKESKGYSASAVVQDNFISTQAESFEELKYSMLEALNFTMEEEGVIYGMDHLRMEYDLESFFDFYKVINAKALSERIGMNQSLLAQYIKGIKKPSAAQTKRIMEGVHQIGKELTEVRFLI